MAVVESSVKGRVGHLVINRPEAKNSLNLEVIRELGAALAKLGADPACRVILFTGSGTEAFCAGADLKELLALKGADARTGFFARIGELVEKISRLRQPVVAKVHGFALAGGCGLAAAADIVLASDEAVFGLPEINIGLVPMVVMAPLSRILSRRTLSQLVLTGERVRAARAREIGLVTEVYPAGALDAEAEKLAQAISMKSGAALEAAKRALFDVTESDYFELLKTLPGRVGELSIGADAEEGISAFLQKRAPQWR